MRRRVPLSTLMIVGAGGAIGTLLRFAVGEVTPTSAIATLSVNLIGALALGFLFGWSPFKSKTSRWQTFASTGMLGGFTTYSALALETVYDGLWLTYVVATVVLGVGAAIVGILTGRSLAKQSA